MNHQHLTLNQKIGQLFFIGISGPGVEEQERRFIQDIAPGGVCLFSRNIRDASQTRHLLDDLRGISPIEPFLSVDQEGGVVDRLRRILAPMPAAGKFENLSQISRSGKIIAETLRLLGFNMDFAPVVDVVSSDRCEFANGLFSRAFGRSKEDVAAFAGAFLTSLQDGGITGCLKHFPGLGATSVDSHEELPQVNISEDELDSTDLFPYEKLISGVETKMVMVAHASYPNHRLQETDQNGKLLPSSLSRNFVTTLLRGKLGFDGVVITDDLEMGAVIKNYGIGDACKKAILAGVDMLAICADPESILNGYSAVLAAVNSGEITESRIDESLLRISNVKNQISTPLPFNAARLQQLSNEVIVLNKELN